MKKIAVYVLNGFLGSGKTTVLLKMIEQYKRENKKVAIILNELGAVNVETHLFKDQQLIELLNGCICCTIQDDLHQTLKSLVVQHERKTIDVLLIEGTGVAHPLEIAEVFTNGHMQQVFDLESVIGVVDASHFLEYLSIFDSTKEIRTLMKAQVLHSSIILLNKMDCVNDQKIPKINKKIDSLKKDEVPVLMTSYGDVDFDVLRKKRIGQIDFQLKKNDHGDHQHHDPHHGTIKTVKIEQVPVVDKRVLTKWLINLPNDVIRAKGLIQLTGYTTLSHVQYADKLVRYTKIGKNDERQPIFVFIGKDLNEEMFQEFSQGLF
jgi:G3E family GTPase